MPKVAKVLMPTFLQKISNLKSDQRGFSLIEILVALLLVSLVVISFPSSDTTEKHRNLKSAVADIERAIGFASNESILRNTVVRLRIAFDKEPIEYNVEYGPPGNMPLPDMPEQKQKSLASDKAEELKLSNLDKSFTKVTEFEEIRHELSPDVQILGVATSFQKKIITEKEASIYFYSTGEKDAALIFFATDQEIAYIDVQPFLSETRTVFEALNPESVAKKEDILQTKMDEVYRAWNSQ
jgi:prepilin-type N-terminal cleavage/methylation domain-containing protein